MSQSKKRARERDRAKGIDPVLYESYPHYNHPGKKAFPRVPAKSVVLMSAGAHVYDPGYVNNRKGSKARRLLEQFNELIASGAKQCRITKLSKRIAREAKKLTHSIKRYDK